MAVYGGFSGSETYRNQRNIRANLTVLNVRNEKPLRRVKERGDLRSKYGDSDPHCRGRAPETPFR